MKKCMDNLLDKLMSGLPEGINRRKKSPVIGKKKLSNDKN